MWVDKYRPKKFTDLLGEDVSFYYIRSLVEADKTASACIAKLCHGSRNGTNVSSKDNSPKQRNAHSMPPTPSHSL